jgi:anti-sigma factor RsiW
VSRHPESELSAYAGGSLSGDERARVEQHLVGCESCRAAVADFRLILDQLATSAPAPPDVAWPRYRAEVRARRDARADRSWGARWLRPLPIAASTAVAAACAIVLYVAVTSRPPSDLAAMEADGLAARIELIDKYQVVEQLDLLEDLDVIRNLDRVAPSTRGG